MFKHDFLYDVLANFSHDQELVLIDKISKANSYQAVNGAKRVFKNAIDKFSDKLIEIDNAVLPECFKVSCKTRYNYYSGTHTSTAILSYDSNEFVGKFSAGNTNTEGGALAKAMNQSPALILILLRLISRGIKVDGVTYRNVYLPEFYGAYDLNYVSIPFKGLGYVIDHGYCNYTKDGGVLYFNKK